MVSSAGTFWSIHGMWSEQHGLVSVTTRSTGAWSAAIRAKDASTGACTGDGPDSSSTSRSAVSVEKPIMSMISASRTRGRSPDWESACMCRVAPTRPCSSPA